MTDSLPHVLYVTHRVPYPPDKGDRIRNYHVLKQLSATARVKLAALADELVPDETRNLLGELCEAVAIEPISRFGKLVNAGRSAITGRSLSEGAFFNRNLKEKIERWHREEPFDAAVISASSLVPYLRNSTLRDIPAFVDVVDVDSQKWFDFADAMRGPKHWLYRFEGKRLRKVERELPNWVNTITLVSDAETKLFNSIVGKDSAMTATNGVDLDYFSLAVRASDGGDIAFVGAMDYLPNIDAATWFAREVWPAIHRRKPDTTFRIIGRNPAREVQALASIPVITIIGSVPDVRPHLADVAVVVVPMRLSRGLQNKVLEALAMGKATVVSPPALAALRAVPGRDLLQATSPQEWTDAVIDLLENEDRRRELGANGRRFVEANHDWETCLKPLMDRIRAVCPQECAT